MQSSSTPTACWRRLALLLVMLVVAIGALAACGGSDEPAAEPAPAPAEEPAAPAEEPAAPAEEPDAPAEEPAAPAEEPAAPAEAPSGDPITIGFPVALSGPINFYDGPIGNMAKLAIDELNAAGGILGRPVEFVESDMASDPAKAGAAAKEVIDKGADVIITSCDFDMGQGAAREATAANIVSIQCAGGELAGFEGLGALHFNIYAGTPAEGAALAQYAIDNGWNNVFLLEDPTIAYDTDLCRFFEEALIAFGGTVAGKDTFQNADASISNQVSAMQAASPDAVAVCSYLPGAAAAIKQIRDVADLPILTGIAQDGTFWLEGIPGASDIFVATTASIAGDDTNADRLDIFARYAEKFGEPSPHGISLEGYQMVKVLAEGITRAGSTDGAAVGAELDKLTDFEVAGDKFTYTPTCHRTARPMIVMQIQDGALSFAAAPTPASYPEAKC